MRNDTHSSRMEQPPPVPVTQPRVQNFAQREGMRLAGWFGSEEVMSWSASDMLAVDGLGVCEGE